MPNGENDSLKQADFDRLSESLEAQILYSSKLDKEIRDLLGQISEQDTVIKQFHSLEDELAAFEEQQSQLEKEKYALKLTSMQEALTVARLSEEIAALDQALALKESAHEKLIKSDIANKKTLQTLTDEIRSLTAIQEEREQQIHAIETEKILLSETTETTKKELSELLSKMSKLLTEKDTAQAALASISTEYHQLALQNATMLQSLDELREELDVKGEQHTPTQVPSLDDEIKVQELERQLSEAQEALAHKLHVLTETIVENQTIKEQARALITKNEVLSEAANQLGVQVKALKETSDSLVQQLSTETERATKAIRETDRTKQALESALLASSQLQADIIHEQSAHALKVGTLEQALLKNSTTAAAELEKVHEQHADALRTLQDKLSTAETKIAQLRQTIDTQKDALGADQLKIEQLNKELVALALKNQHLANALETSQNTSADAQRVLQAQLLEQSAIAHKAQLDLASTLQLLETAQLKNQTLAEQLPILQEANTGLLKQIQRLETNLTEKDASLLEQRDVTTQKEWEIARLSERLVQHAETMATDALKAYIQSCETIPLLKRVASTESNADLSAIEDLTPDALIGLSSANAYQPIKNSAIARLAVLHDNAIEALKETTNKFTTSAALENVATVTTNADLPAVGFNESHVAALKDEDAYQTIKTFAAARIQAHTEAMAALQQSVENTDEVALLQAIAGAKNNRALEAIVFEEHHPAALVDWDAFTTIVALAEQKLIRLNVASRPNLAPPAEEVAPAPIAEPVVVIEPRLPSLLLQDEAIAALLHVINNSKDRTLLEHISRADNNDELYLDDLNRKHVKALIEEDAHTILTTAADTRLEALRVERERKRAGYLSPNYNTFLDEDNTNLSHTKKHMGSIHSVDNKIRDELRLLAHIQPIHWFNPGFQSAAKKHATEMAVHFEELAKGCHVLLHYLKPLRGELTEQLDSIPTDDAMKDAHLNKNQIKDIQGRRALIARYLQMVEKELERYKPVSTLLKGDHTAEHPMLKQGLLKTLQHANAEKDALKLFPFNSSTSDHPMAERAQHFQSNYLSRPAADNATTLIQPAAGDASKYEIVPRVKPLEFREHTINGDTPTVGSFIEERASSFHAPANADHPDERPYVPDIKLTINKFPTKANTPDNDPELVKARIEYALAMASQLLAGSSGTPSRDKPVILRGANAEELRYLWTAVMIIGEKVPYMKFDHHAIQVQSTKFHPKDEMSGFFSFGNFNKKSCYETYFKPHMSLVDELTGGIKEVGTHKLGHQQARQSTTQAVKTVSSMYKTKLDETLTVLKEDQERRGPGH